jgi:hypothetical protein
MHVVEMKSALSETLCFQSFGHLLCIFMHYHVYFSMFMSRTFFARIPSCGCNLSSIILCSGHKYHMLYRILGFCVASFFESKIFLLPHWISVSSQMLFQVWRCASVMPGLADPLISHSAIHRFPPFQFRTFISFCVCTALGAALGLINYMHSLNILLIPFCISLGSLTQCVHCTCSTCLSFH